MIAVDTSSLVAYLSGNEGADVNELDRGFQMKQVMIPPVVLSEILSDHKLDKNVVDLILQIPLLPISEGFWYRAGCSRAKLLSKGFKARVADALIAQNCIDNQVALLTRDSDFRHFHKLCHLKLALI